MDSRLSNWDSERVVSRSGPSAAPWTREGEARGDMHVGEQLSGGSPTLRSAFGAFVAIDIATVWVRGELKLYGAPILRAASASRSGASLGAGIPGQGDSIVRRQLPC